MNTGPMAEFSEEQEKYVRRAVRIQLVTIVYLISVVTLMYMVMGSSQAMKTAWVEDILGLVPPIVFLITNKMRRWTTSRHYPYGFHRVTSIGFLVASLALLSVGAGLLLDSVTKLAQGVHPTIGMEEYFGQDVWLGWWMVLVLLWGTFPPVLLGRMKMDIAKKLHEKILYTDAKMNKADWMTAAAGIVGVIGIGFGYWWLDAVAAIFIAFDIVKDGWRQSRDATTELINRAPKDLAGHFLDLPLKTERYLKKVPWVKDAKVRMYEQGHIIVADIFVRPRQSVSESDVENLREEVRDLDWRLQDTTLTLTTENVLNEYQ